MTAAAGQRTELEEARVILSEGFLRLWEEADSIDALLAAGKPTEAAIRDVQMPIIDGLEPANPYAVSGGSTAETC
jgi:hypothetical protein